MTETIFEKDYRFGRIEITDEKTQDGIVRTLLCNGASESACYVDKGRHFDLRFGYNQVIADLIRRTDSDRRVLLIGGAGFTLPKYFISSFSSGHMDVVELHRQMYDIAMKYFFLDELYVTYHPDRTGRLRVFFGDGNQYIDELSGRLMRAEDRDAEGYDIVFDDAFSGRIHDSGMLSDHTAGCISMILRRGGIYAANMITPFKGYGSMQLELSKKILKNYFKHVKAWQVNPGRNPGDRQNCILCAGDALP